MKLKDDTLPDGWKWTTLSCLSVKITDGEHLTPRRESSGYYLLSARNVHNGYVDLTDVDYVGLSEYTRIRNRCNPDPGDVLISCSGSIGRVTVVPPGLECVLVRSAALVKPDRGKLVGEYAQFALQSAPGQSQMQARVNQGAQPNLFLGHIEQLQIALPPSLPEQRAIAEALSDVDALIAALDALIAKKRAVKTAAMQQLLTGRQRLPGFSEEWASVVLSDIGTFTKGKGIRKDEVSPDGLPCVRYGELYTRHADIIRDFASHISPAVAATAQPIRQGDILFAGSGETKAEIGMAAAYLGIAEAYAGGDIIILSPKNADSAFLGYLLNTPPVAAQKASRAQGDAVVHISASALGQIAVDLPPLDEQAAIAAVLSDMDAEIAALVARRDKTAAIKTGMMQELLTGRTRLVPSAS